MLEFDAKVKKWGNSLAVVVPSEEAKSGGLKPNQRVHIIAIQKTDVARRAVGPFPYLKPFFYTSVD